MLDERFDCLSNSEPNELKQASINENLEEEKLLSYLQKRFFLKTIHLLELTQVAESMKCILDCRANQEGQVGSADQA
jgi:hypothetical protein